MTTRNAIKSPACGCHGVIPGANAGRALQTHASATKAMIYPTTSATFQCHPNERRVAAHLKYPVDEFESIGGGGSKFAQGIHSSARPHLRRVDNSSYAKLRDLRSSNSGGTSWRARFAKAANARTPMRTNLPRRSSIRRAAFKSFHPDHSNQGVFRSHR
jgi:hypothetical protein